MLPVWGFASKGVVRMANHRVHRILPFLLTANATHFSVCYENAT